MHNTIMQRVSFSLILLFTISLSACSPAKVKVDPSLTWKIEVSRVEIKADLKSVETVTQYDGSRLDVAHEQTPAVGDEYVFLKMILSKSGAQSIPFDWKDITLRDQAGKVYHRHENDSFLEQYNYSPRMTGLEIRFGVNEGWVCFEIPAQSARGKMPLVDSAAGSAQEIVLPKSS